MRTQVKYKIGLKDPGFVHQPGDSYYLATNGNNVPYIYRCSDDLMIGWIPTSEHKDADGGDSYFEPNTQYFIKAISLTDKEIIVEHDYYTNPATPTTTQTTKKESMLTQILETNKQAAIAASKLEAGRLATSTLTAIIEAKFPQLPSTPLNGLILANVADVVAKNFKPSPRLNALTNAMVVSAYSDLLQGLDLEGLLTQFLESTAQIEIPE